MPDSPEDYIHRIDVRAAQANQELPTRSFPRISFFDLREIEYHTQHLLETHDVEGFEYADDRLIPNPKRPTAPIAHWQGPQETIAP